MYKNNKKLTGLHYKGLIDMNHSYEQHNKETIDSLEASVWKFKT